MIHNTKKTLGLLLMMLLTTGLFAQQSLLVPFTGTMTAEQQSVYSNLLALPTTKWVEIVSINSSAFEDATIQLNLSPTFNVSVPKRDIGYTGIQAKTWIGTFPSMLGTATFVWLQNDRVQGHISSTEGNFELFGLGGGVYLIAEHDSESFGGCSSANDNPRDPRQELVENPNAPDMSLDDQGTVGTPVYTEVDDECFIRMIIGYTPQAKTSTLSLYGRSMNEHIALATADANASYFNSNVETRVELAFVWQATQNSTTSASNDANSLRGTTDGLWDQIHDFRDFYDGDMVGMITGTTYAGLCGTAYGFDYTDATNMFQVSTYDCIVGNFTMDHEFGHNRGCRHDNDGTTTPFAYGHGYNQGSIFRTIMAVCCSPVRVNYWSNPDINFPGGGGAMGTVGFNDNARALDVGDFTVARHRITPVAFSTGISLTSDETLNMVTTGTLTSTNDAPSGSILTLKSRTQVVLSPGFNAFSGCEARIFIESNCPGTSYARTVDVIEDELLSQVNGNPFVAELYPNPSDRQITVQFTLPQADNISIALFDMKGRQVAALNSGAQFDAGQHTVSFDVSSLAAGHYLCNIMGDDQQSTIPMVITR